MDKGDEKCGQSLTKIWLHDMAILKEIGNFRKVMISWKISIAIFYIADLIRKLFNFYEIDNKIIKI